MERQTIYTQEEDPAAGKLDFLSKEAVAEKNRGMLENL